MFSTVLHLLMYSLIVVVLPVGFDFNLTYGLKPQVSGLKIVTVYRRSIFQVEWVIAIKQGSVTYTTD